MSYASKSYRRAKLLAEGGLEKTAVGLARPLTKTELATTVDCSERFIEKEVAAGRLRAIKLSSRAMRFLQSDIIAWLRSKETTAEAKS